MNANQYHIYQVAISPDLGITAEEFARAWNADPDTHELATAHFAEEKASQFIDPSLLIAALLSVPANVASAALYDLIKGVIDRLRREKNQAQASPPSTAPSQTVPSHIRYTETRKPDGTVIVAFDIYNR